MIDRDAFFKLLTWRPRIAWRRATDPMLRRLIERYIANRRSQAEPTILRWIDNYLRCGKLS